MIGFGGGQTTRGQEWKREASEEVGASCPGARPCSEKGGGEMHVGVAKGSFRTMWSDVNELKLEGYRTFRWEMQSKGFSYRGQRYGQMVGGVDQPEDTRDMERGPYPQKKKSALRGEVTVDSVPFVSRVRLASLLPSCQGLKQQLYVSAPHSTPISI